jgi:hypothetical protein
MARPFTVLLLALLSTGSACAQDGKTITIPGANRTVPVDAKDLDLS